MAVPNPFRRDTPNTRRRWGYRVELTPEHLTPESMYPLKYTYDKLADDCLLKLHDIQAASNRRQSSSSKQGNNDSDTSSPPQRPDLFALLQDNHNSDPAISKLWESVNNVPSWVDWTQIARGQDVFYRYGGANLTGLLFQSLLGGMGSARVVETLTRTGAFNTNSARRRLYETTQHILQVTKDIESVKPGGKGWQSSVRVRLLHSAIRVRIMNLEKEQPGYYDVQAFGVPASDIDSIATIATFSSSLLWHSLPLQGLFVTAQEADDYIALWRYVAYLLGCPTDPYFCDAKHARRTLDSLILFEINPSPTSCILAHNLIAAVQYTPPIYASPDMLLATARWLNGHELCDALDLGRPKSWYYYALMAGQCLFFMGATYTCRVLNSWDRKKQAMLRKAFWIMIVESQAGLQGRETSFEMKWIPKLGKITPRADQKERIDAAWSIETRNLKTLGWFFLGVVIMTWVISKLAKSVPL